jgi:inner membrane protein
VASLFTHAFVGAAIGRGAGLAWRKDRRFWPTVVALSILPDIDSLGFHMGVPYGALWGHRGLTHSLLFALLVGIWGAMWLDGRFHRQWKLAFVLFLVVASHGVLDAMTNGGLGVAFFSPIDTERYFLPWRPILVSPIGAGRFFSTWGMRIMANEILWIWCPTIAVLVLIKLAKSLKEADQPGARSLGNDQG